MNLRVHSWYCTVFLPVTLVLVVLFCGVSRTQSLPAQSPRPALIQFTNVTAAAGIKFTHFRGNEGIPIDRVILGPGVCLEEFDGDGFRYIYFGNGRYLYRRGI